MSPSRQFANHPDPMDLWLETQGYYRKLTARDGSCLFRAVSEHVYFTQKYHLDVRRRCVEYMRDHLDLFDGLSLEGGADAYLENLQNPLQWGTSLEIIALSHLYKIDVIIFKEVGVPALKAADTFYGKRIMLCFSHERHYDSVYLKEFTKNASFCQSLVYELLYKKVFGMKDVDYAVEKMLHYKPLKHRGEPGGSRKFFSYSCNSIQLQRKGITLEALLDDGEVNVRDLLMKGVTPFPYKVAKSLDPSIYRNVEFDVWIDYRRGLRQGYFGTNNELQVGVKCLVKIEENSYVGHIQEMAPEKGPVILFVEELGEKRTVSYETLEILPQEPLSLKHISGGHSNQRSAAINQKSSSSPESVGGIKVRKGRLDSGSKENGSLSLNGQLSVSSIGGRRNNSRSDQGSIAENSTNDTLGRSCGVFSDSNMVPSFSNFSVDSYNPNVNFNPYQLKSTVELSMAVPIMMPGQQHSNSQILIPVSPRPEDVPAHWLSPNDVEVSGELCLSPTGGDYFLSQNPNEVAHPLGQEENTSDSLANTVLDENANYLPDLNLQEPQINFNAPKSVMDDGTDLPISDIQTLRFFYNLGNDVYRAQYNMQYGWGIPSPSPPTPQGMCSGKCVCGPVCITTVPSIHRLLEPTTPPTNPRRRRKDSTGANNAVANETESPSSSTSQPLQSTTLASVPPRFRIKGKHKKDTKAYEGQPLVHQPTLQIPTNEDSTSGESLNAGSLAINTDHAPPTLSIPYSPPYSYVYYPTSPVVPFSPVDSDPYFTPLRLQFPTEYLPDTPQSPQCYSINGDMGVFGSSAQYSMMTTPPHYLVPASPGIYVGSPPGWSPLTPSPPQQQS